MCGLVVAADRALIIVVVIVAPQKKWLECVFRAGYAWRKGAAVFWPVISRQAKAHVDAAAGRIDGGGACAKCLSFKPFSHYHALGLGLSTCKILNFNYFTSNSCAPLRIYYLVEELKHRD